MSESLREYVTTKYQEQILDEYIKKGSYSEVARTLGLDPSNVRRTILNIKSRVVDGELYEAYSPKIFYYDIETTNFNGDFGEVLMYAYQWAGEAEPTLVSVLDYPKSFSLPVEKRDRFVLQHLSEQLNQADIICAHYGKKFDNKFVQARLAVHGLPYFDNRSSKMFDTCLVARNNMKIGRNTLANLAQAMGLSEEKTSLTKTQWRRANDYDAEALTAMGEYCLQDVRTLVQLAQRLRPLAKHLPSWLTMSGGEDMCCHACGGDLQAKGEWHTKSQTYQRYQCKKCGAWQRGAKPKRSSPPDQRTMY